MIFLESILSVLLIILSVWYAERLVRLSEDEKTLLLNLSISLVLIMLTMWISDAMLVTQKQLLRDSTKDEILAMVKYLFGGIVVLYLSNQKIKP